MTPANTDKAAARSGPGYLLIVIISMIVSMVTAISTVAVYDQRFAQKIVTMDLRGYLRQERDKAMAGELDETGLRQSLDAMEAALLAVPANQTVVLKEVVLRNAQELKP